jgi:transposase
VEQILKDRISKTRNETRKRHSCMICKTFELKIDSSRLNKIQKESLKMLFIEAKWFYNHLLNERDKIFEADCKQKEILVKNKNGEFETRTLKFLGTKYRQSIIQSMRRTIYALSQAKKCGNKVGKLKFKKEFSALNLIFTKKGGKSGGGYYICDNKVKIIGMNRKMLVVNGGDQLPKNCEFGPARLLRRPSGFYVYVTTYSKKEEIEEKGIDKKLKEVGLDFGVKEMITTSDSEVISHVSIQESDHLKRLQQKLNRSQKGSKNRYKTIQKIRIEYEKIVNKKEDISNKIVHKLVSIYKTIYVQDDNFNGWAKKKQHWSKIIHHSCLGRIKEKLIQKGAIKINCFFSNNPIVLWMRT